MAQNVFILKQLKVYLIFCEAEYNHHLFWSLDFLHTSVIYIIIIVYLYVLGLFKKSFYRLSVVSCTPEMSKRKKKKK